MAAPRYVIGYALILALLVSTLTPVVAAQQSASVTPLLAKAEALKLLLERLLVLNLPPDLEKRVKTLASVNITKLSPEELKNYISEAEKALKDASAYLAQLASRLTNVNITLEQLKKLLLERLELLAKKLHVNITKEMIAEIENAKSIEELLKAAREVRNEILEVAATDALNITIEAINVTISNPRTALAIAADVVSRASEVLEKVYSKLLAAKADPQTLLAIKLALDKLMEAKSLLEEYALNMTAANATAGTNITRIAMKELEKMRKIVEELLKKNTTSKQLKELLKHIEHLEKKIEEGGVTPAILVKIGMLKEKLLILENLVSKADEIRAKLAELRSEIEAMLNKTKSERVAEFARHLLRMIDDVEKMLEKGMIISAANLLGRIEEGVNILKSIEAGIGGKASAVKARLEKELEKLEKKLEKLKQRVERLSGLTRLVAEQMIHSIETMLKHAWKAVERGEADVAAKIVSMIKKAFDQLEHVIGSSMGHEKSTSNATRGTPHTTHHHHHHNATSGHEHGRAVNSTAGVRNETRKHEHRKHQESSCNCSKGKTGSKGVRHEHPHPEHQKHGSRGTNETRHANETRRGAGKTGNATRVGRGAQGEHNATRHSGRQSHAQEHGNATRNAANNTRSKHENAEKGHTREKSSEKKGSRRTPGNTTRTEHRENNETRSGKEERKSRGEMNKTRERRGNQGVTGNETRQGKGGSSSSTNTTSNETRKSSNETRKQRSSGKSAENRSGSKNSKSSRESSKNTKSGESSRKSGGSSGRGERERSGSSSSSRTSEKRSRASQHTSRGSHQGR